MTTVPVVRRADPGRVALVTLGLSLAGTVFGGFAGAAAFGIAIVTHGGFHLGDLVISVIPGIIGAGLGAVLAPLAGWALLRRVPLGRAFFGLTVGTILGGIAGFVTHDYLGGFFIQPVLAAAVGFCCAAVGLRVLHSRALPPSPS
ncbi:MAG TPA: hypothetical protein VEV39_00640 [Gemmatimonadales bacterium]|nr:hypothetical protein [Gemmatimonadales bacterium]